MAIQKLQLNINKTNPSFKQQKDYKSYLEAEGTINTENNVKPLPPQGHLVHDNLITGTKYFFKDIGYDMKSVKEGYLGTANDHKLGRLNDVGLRLGGIGIAAYLASRTADPKTRMMEYIGLATFLTAMAIYPKLAINGPAKLLHGYDIDKEYIDDQGRKKSVQQDSNYVPYDMYQGGRKDEDLDIIGDRMGIPRDIKNRNDVIREQMRKIATQNNTLWMLTAGFATPLITAIACNGLENYVIAPSIAKTTNNKTNIQIENMYSTLKKMVEQNESPEANKLSKNIENILSAYKNSQLPKEECENIINMITKGLTDQTSKSIRKDLEEILIKEDVKTESIISLAKKEISKDRHFLIPTEQEFDAIARNVLNDTSGGDKIELFKKQIEDSILSKCEQAGNKKLSRDDKLVTFLTEEFKKKKASSLSPEAIEKITNLAKIIGDFKIKEEVLNSCKHFKFESAPETILARSAAKFEKEFLKELNISFKDLKKMSKDEKFAEKLLDQKFTELAQDKTKFERVMKKLANISVEMDANLNGANDQEIIRKLINAYEYLFNGTANRLEQLGGFGNTIETLAKTGNDRNTLIVNNAKELFGFLDGTIITDLHEENIRLGKLKQQLEAEGKFEEAKNIQENIIDKNTAIIDKIKRKVGAGSDKHNTIARIAERYNDVTSGFNRILHAIDTYKRLFTDKDVIDALYSKDPEYIKKVIDKCKDVLLKADSEAHLNKFKTINAHEQYIDIMNTLYRVNKNNLKEGIVSDFTNDALEGINTTKDISFLQRFKNYIGKFRSLMGNHEAKFMEKHILDKKPTEYSPILSTDPAKSKTISNSPVKYAMEAAGRKYNNQKWGRIIGGTLGGVLAVTLLAQFGFGKIRNPQNLQKQVNNDTSK